MTTSPSPDQGPGPLIPDIEKAVPAVHAHGTVHTAKAGADAAGHR
jgi:hypothetical protein